MLFICYYSLEKEECAVAINFPSKTVEVLHGMDFIVNLKAIS